MLNMSGNHVIGNRNSTPEANSASSLRPPSSRAVGSTSSLRASADMSSISGPAPSSRIRPSSDFYGQSQQSHGQGSFDTDSQDKIAQQWIADIDQYETTLEEMAAATLDQDFKDELSAIEQWFRVLSEAERTAALYALLQQTTQVQIRFFIQVLQQMGKNHPMSGVLSPATFDKDPMSNRLSDAMNKLTVDSSRNSFTRTTASTAAPGKRHSVLDSSTINAMFPDAAAAIATEKAKFTQQTGNPPSSNRNSAAVDPRSSMAGHPDSRDAVGPGVSPWGSDQNNSKGSASQAPMGQFAQPASGGLRSPLPQLGNNAAIQNTTLAAPEKNPSDLPMLSPYNGGGSGNWASMVNTPMTSTFNTSQQPGSQADMVANATAMKLAALSTVNNRFALDDARKYRRARSNDAPGSSQISSPPAHSHGLNIPGANVVMINEHGQVLSREQILALQAQQGMALGNRSRPKSPGLAMQQPMGQMAQFASPQHNGFLSAYDGSSGVMTSSIPAVNLGQLALSGHEGYLSDHSDMVRDPTLLQDIPSWLRSLRLHKYTDNLKDMKWTDLIELDDKALEDRGVNALGARRKMLKVFEQVKGLHLYASGHYLPRLVQSRFVGETMTSPGHDDNSDADSDLEELQGDIAKFDESVREFLASHGGSGDSQAYDRPLRGGPRGRGSRGPRKAAKPRGDITARLSRVNQAFLAGDYDRALELVSEVIRINAETHQAWTAMASIFREQGELDRALAAMVYAAHLRPKDIGGWMSCASYALDNTVENKEANFKTARLCFSAALRADPQNVEARLGKADVCHSQGHYSQAILEYNYLLKQRPADLDIVRKLAEACADNKENPSTIAAAKTAYRRFFDLVIPTGPGDRFEGLWYDIGIYIDLCASSGSYRETIKELKALARWMIGRASEEYWDGFQDDDREWDQDNNRRNQCPEFDNSSFPESFYGESLPLDLRMRLAILRLRLLEKNEAMLHLELLDLSTQAARDFITEFPSVAYDLAEELMKSGVTEAATKILEIFRETSDIPDSTILLQLGRCYILAGEQPKAEECFLSAIDVDEDSIDARVELANMYEKAKEGEEALILAAEAMALQDAQHHQAGHARMDLSGRLGGPQGELRRRMSQNDQNATTGGPANQARVPRRYRPKRLAGADTLRQDEQARAIKLSRQYDIVRDLKLRISQGQTDLTQEWMNASRDLVDDFRSLKRFYSWDKYLHFLRKRPTSTPTPSQGPESELSQMYERLTRSLAPQADNSMAGTHQGMHQGISFDNWLNIFLDYAIGLAVNHQREEAYQVCEAAKDSVVFQASNHEFLIHIAWTVCAIYTNDEERCVAIARHLMRDGVMSDSNRMFALLSRLCQSPVSWYTSGPAQKFILRQIRAIDNSYEELFTTKFSPSDAGEVTFSKIDMDICLLMLYGHILFTSTSYTYAISYFLRARSLDPHNAMVNLSLGLAYVHYGLKRQSTNRQYLLLQGQAFISQYLEADEGTVARPLAERYYNTGRLFQLLGLNQLGSELYSKAIEANAAEHQNEDIDTLVAINSFMSFLTVGNKAAAFSLLKKKIVL
ncbi:hypothetical protein NLG97_g166 [Lecanicillium saksenae]|uniref:Uncharacterized protein n=1 Tax=Lecanicillium saksenae TaxID=468837 RepID=A0ACC1R7C4_9HYPO|nr:hypothetical protein NLG97_g166 [Lecanicillium saksenae]